MPKPARFNKSLYVHENQKARYDGQPRTSTSTLTQLLNYGHHTTQCKVWYMGALEILFIIIIIIITN